MTRLAVLQLVCVTLSGLLASCGGTDSTGDLPPVPVGDTLFTEDNVFEIAMVQTGIAETLQGQGEFTLFYPAPEKLLLDLQEAGLTEDEFLELDNLSKILSYHVALGTYYLQEYEAGATVETLAGPTVSLKATDQSHATVNEIAILSPVYDTGGATNGEVEYINGILLPPGETL